MSWRNPVIVLGVMLAVLPLSACGPRPAAEPLTLLEAVAIVYAQQAGIAVPEVVVRQVEAIMRGETDELTPVEVTDDNFLISPLTGGRCPFVTRDGLTRAGIALVNTLMQENRHGRAE